MFAITYRKYLYAFSIALMVASVALLATVGLKPSIDFTGGSLLEVTYTTSRPEQAAIESAIRDAGITTAVVRQSGDASVLIKTAPITNETKEQVLGTLSAAAGQEVREDRFTTVGPTLGRELYVKSGVALLLVLIAIVLYVAYVFRKVSKPVSSWLYGHATIIALAHDIVVTLGVFSLLGLLIGTEIDTLFVTALLVVLGYSVNDSIVVLDRVRENLAQQEEQERGRQFAQTVGRSIKETLGRSFNTSFTTLLALLALAVFGADATRSFAIALLVGIGFGTYSSIAVASALLVSFFEGQKKRPHKKRAA
ncbi:MAG: hypothetical protein RL150_58 [Candidatus Parcubacteria bacterium]|jgi:preprotein translocase subunit SecF